MKSQRGLSRFEWTATVRTHHIPDLIRIMSIDKCNWAVGLWASHISDALSS